MNGSEKFTIRIATSAADIGQPAWDSLSAGRPFASYRWIRFCETAMADSPASHITLEADRHPLARASFWRVANEPLPLPALVRPLLAAYFKRRPLLICRAPFASWTGLILPDEPSLRREAFGAIHQSALQLLANQHASFLLFDFLQADDLPADQPLATMTLPDPGTILPVRWKTFEEYLAATTSRNRKHYKHTQREARAFGLTYSTRASVTDVSAALSLIRKVEKKFKSAPNPWMRALLENIETIDGIYQEVRQAGKLVGCCLLLEDNGVMFPIALGLEDVPFAYFLLAYGFVQEAIARGVHTLRLGSGAYEVKHRLGGALEDNNHIAIDSQSAMLKKMINLFK